MTHIAYLDYELGISLSKYKSILVVWLECRFLVTEVDGLNPGNSMLFP